MSNYELLANAIVEQAARDYEKYLVEDHNGSTSKTRANLREVERYFTGEDIKIHTKLDGVTLMNAIRAQVEEFDYDLKALYKARHGSDYKEEEEIEEEIEEEP